MPKFEIKLSPQAKEDLTNIRAYTLDNHGSNQAEKYLSSIEQAFVRILDNPEIGRIRNDVKEGYRSLVIEKHVCFYKITKNQIDILGVVHSRMDVMNHFSTE